MGAVIKATAACLKAATSSMEIAAQAGKACIEKAGIRKEDIGLVINTGVYRDENIVEPAMAPLILKRMGLNLDPVMGAATNFTFGFDLHNGSCGFINALQVADSVLRAGRTRYVLIVSSDIHPSRAPHSDFAFTPAGTAVLLCNSEEQHKGFIHCFINTSTNGYEGLVGGADVMQFHTKGINGRKTIFVKQDEGYIDKLCDFTASSARDYFKTYAVDLSKIDYLVTSQQEKGFTRRIHTALGLNGNTQSFDLFSRHGDPHTSALPLGMHLLMEADLLKANNTVLFAAGGSGLTAAFATYVV